MAKFVPKFWKPGTEAPGVHEERQQVSEGSGEAVVHNQNASLSIQQQRQRLPVFKYRNQILYLVERYQTVVIVGETGCGKSTQIPQYLLEAGWGAEGHVIGVTQPRRVACTTVANRVAEERGAVLGHEVGYSIRFDNRFDPEATRIKFLTDGMLVREMMADPLLKKYSILMLDEAHERTLHTDIIIGLLKKIQKKREDLRIIVSSATLDAKAFRDFFNKNVSDLESFDTAHILSIEGRAFPVNVYYRESPVPDYAKATVDTIVKIHEGEKAGDILAFLTGQEEVDSVVSDLIEYNRTNRRHVDGRMKMKVLPMYAALPPGEQLKVFERVSQSTRKIVVATNIAEASITINGIVYVVDSGFVKLRAYNPQSGVAEEDFHKLQTNTVPEMQRSNFAFVILQLKALGISNILRFNFLSSPPAQIVIRGLEVLYALGALDKDGELTRPLGSNMAEFPLSPMFAKMLLESGKFGCSEEILTIAAVLQVQSIFVHPSNRKIEALRAHHKFAVEEGDLVTMLNVYEAFLKNNKSSRWCQQHFLHYKGLVRATMIREQLRKLLVKFDVPMNSSEGDVDPICQCIVAGFFANAARFHPTGVYRTVRDDHELHIHPNSCLYREKPPGWVVFNEVLHTSKQFMRDVTVIDPSWLYELAPHYYEYGTERELAAKRARLE
uniref:RNA helicase n=1 Tax=Branchiostoma floridae TaxID=7739 RepID=C3YFD5_BRAFL|eukprot:XP_002604888.1 hypothetical protein BRAFLDRAFT_264370 [Branchiostoma floridae]